MSTHRPAGELARAMDWAPLEQYVPDLTSTGASPAGETTTGRFRRYGTLAYVSGTSTLSASVGSGEYRVSLPTGWVAATVTGMTWQGSGRATDVSASTNYHIIPAVASAGTVIWLNWQSSTGAFVAVTALSPFTMASGDILSWGLWLELDST